MSHTAERPHPLAVAKSREPLLRAAVEHGAFLLKGDFVKRTSFLLAAVLAIGAAGTASAQFGVPRPQCSNGQCPNAPQFTPQYIPSPVVVPTYQPAIAPRIEWRHLRSHPNESYLYLNGVQVGGFDRSMNVWRDYDEARDVWGEPVNVFPSLIPPTPILFHPDQP